MSDPNHTGAQIYRQIKVPREVVGKQSLAVYLFGHIVGLCAKRGIVAQAEEALGRIVLEQEVRFD
jgi:hypothetical protein